MRARQIESIVLNCGILVPVLILVDLVLAKNCNIHWKHVRRSPFQRPLVFSASGQLHETVEHYHQMKISIAADEDAFITCAETETPLKVRCNGESGELKLENNEALDSQDLFDIYHCHAPAISEVLYPVQGCSNSNWTSTVFGYVQPIEQVVHIIGEACYDEHVGRTIFVRVKLNNGTVTYIRKLDKNFFEVNRVPDRARSNDFYYNFNPRLINDYVRRQLHWEHKPYLAIGNFIDPYLLGNFQLEQMKKFRWNHFIKMEHASEFRMLKRFTYDLSKATQLDVYVGSQGVHKMRCDSKNKTIEIYAQPGESKRYPMPAFTWLMVKQDDNITAIGVINEDGIRSKPNTLVNNEPECPSGCENITWIDRVMKDSEHNIVRCCNHEELLDSVPEISELLYFLTKLRY